MEILNTQVWGFEGAIRGARNPYNSWNRIDSYYDPFNDEMYIIGEADLKLMKSLVLAGNEHCKFLRMIHVQADFNMPRYFWSEADTYHFGTKNSCSTMHKLLNNETPISLALFEYCDEDLDALGTVIARLEELRQQYRHIQATTKDNAEMERLLLRAKRLLPEGMLQLRTWDTNYAELRNIYFQRRHHRLKEEWVETFCKWVESLPYAPELITLEKESPKNMNINIKYFTDITPIEMKDGGDWIDLRAAETTVLKQDEFKLIPLGIAMKLPEGYEAHVVPRSSTFKNFGIIQTNHQGVIDESYCGDNDQWFFPAYALRTTVINKDDRICQFRIVKKMPKVEFHVVDKMTDKDRGGHGSTGTK